MLTTMARACNKLVYLIQETGLGLRRGGWLNWAAISTLMVLLFLVGISLELSWGLEATVRSFGDQLQISVYLTQDSKGSELQPRIQAFPHVASVTLIPREQAWRDLLVDMGMTDKQAAEAQLGANPLVDTLRVQADAPEYLGPLTDALQRIDAVDAVYYGDQVVEQLSRFQETLRLGSLTITAILTLTTVAVITTTIRLIVMARRREIEVMQLVGATPTWIYLPFVLQGALFGLIGSGAAYGLVVGSQQLLYDLFNHLLSLPFLRLLQPLEELNRGLLPMLLLGLGTLLGTTSSLIAVRKSAGR